MALERPGDGIRYRVEASASRPLSATTLDPSLGEMSLARDKKPFIRYENLY